MNRNDFELWYFYNQGSGFEGTEVYRNDRYLGWIPNLIPEDIECMSDNEFFCLLDESGIVY